MGSQPRRLAPTDGPYRAHHERGGRARVQTESQVGHTPDVIGAGIGSIVQHLSAIT